MKCRVCNWVIRGVFGGFGLFACTRCGDTRTLPGFTSR